MSNPYKPIPAALFVEASGEYQFGSIFKFDSSTGKADIQTAYRDEDNGDALGWEFPKNVDAARIESFPCSMPDVGVQNQNVFHMGDSDPRNWQMGNLISKNSDGTTTYSIVDTANPGSLLTVTTAKINPLNTGDFFLPIVYFKVTDDIGAYFAANWGPVP